MKLSMYIKKWDLGTNSISPVDKTLQEMQSFNVLCLNMTKI